MSSRILIVEDEDRLRRVIELQLRSGGYEVEMAATAELALSAADRADLILTDLRLPGMDGLAFLTQLRQRQITAPVVIMTAFSSVETAVEAMKAGAQDFLPKPFSMDHLMTVVVKALEVRSLRVENRNLREQLGARYDVASIIGNSPGMRDVLAMVERVAPTRATVLLVGESGVGKDLIARAIHYQSPRRDKPFVKINCTAIPEPLMESELFGYEKGAFTGANVSKPGKFEQADTGTVFLDEIGDVPMAVQVKLLRILQERELERLGSNRDAPGGCARDRGHQRGSEEGARAGHVPRGSFLSPQRHADSHSAATRAPRRYPGVGGTVRAEGGADARVARRFDFTGSYGAARGFSVARQRQAARKCD
jgi:DNA-binding NtrC family response regulator